MTRTLSLLAALGSSLALAAAGCVAQTEECRRFIECRRAYDTEAGLQPADLAAWEPAGDCWVNGDAAADCTQQCTEELADVQEAADAAGYDLPECA